jgi:hypothetical protein
MAEAALDYDYFEPDETLEIPDGGIADFLTAKTGSWADDEVPSSGIAKVKGVADQLAEYGRHEDEYIVHAAEGETVIPMEVFRTNPILKENIYQQMRDMGLSPERYVVGNDLNSINPITGQPEFFLKKLFKGVKKGLKKVIKVVKKIAPIVLPIVLAMTPLGPIYGAMAGSGIASLLQGGNLKAALKSAAISGAIGGILRGVQGGIQGARAGTGFGQGFKESIGQSLSAPGARFSQALGGARPEGASYWGSPTRDIISAEQAAVQDRALALTDKVSEQLTPSIDAGMQVPDIQTQIPQATNIPQPPAFIPGGPPGTPVAPNIATEGPYTMKVTPGRPHAFAPGKYTQPAAEVAAPDFDGRYYPDPRTNQTPGALQRTKFTLPEDSYSQYEDLYRSKLTGLDPSTMPYQATTPTPYPTAAERLAESLSDWQPGTPTTLQLPAGAPSFREGIKRAFTPGDDVGFFEGMGQAFFPKGPSAAEVLTAQGISNPTYIQMKTAEALAEEAGPDWMRKLLPIFGASLLAGKLAGGPGDSVEEDPLFDPAITGETLLAENPEEYMVAINPPPPITIQQWEGTGTGPRPTIRWAAPTGAAGGNVAAFPPRIGGINGPGTGTSDDVPAMLSDGEFVFTADSVRGAGNGSRRQGTNNLYNLMRNFEGRV